MLDGVYRRGSNGEPVFVEVAAPSDEAPPVVLHKIINRILKLLTRRGALVEEQGATYMADNDADSDDARTLMPLQAAAHTYHVAFGPRAGQKVLTVQNAMTRDTDLEQALCANMNGFSLHAAVRCGADERKPSEQLCRYITRPALANERVQCNAAGQVVSTTLKSPCHEIGSGGVKPFLLANAERIKAALVPSLLAPRWARANLRTGLRPGFLRSGWLRRHAHREASCVPV